MKIYNTVTIEKNIDFVFNKTNDIDNWKNLFSEYKETEVLLRHNNTLIFRLKNLHDKEWISWRNIDYKKNVAIAKRLYPMFPFESMDIRWEYEKLNENKTKMTWIQEFKPHKDFPKAEKEMKHFLDKNTKKQQNIIKEKLESNEKVWD